MVYGLSPLLGLLHLAITAHLYEILGKSPPRLCRSTADPRWSHTRPLLVYFQGAGWSTAEANLFKRWCTASGSRASRDNTASQRDTGQVPYPDFAGPQASEKGRIPDPFWFDFKTRDGPPLKQIDLKHWYTAESEGIQSALSGRT